MAALLGAAASLALGTAPASAATDGDWTNTPLTTGCQAVGTTARPKFGSVSVNGGKPVRLYAGSHWLVPGTTLTFNAYGQNTPAQGSQHTSFRFYAWGLLLTHTAEYDTSKCGRYTVPLGPTLNGTTQSLAPNTFYTVSASATWSQDPSGAVPTYAASFWTGSTVPEPKS